MKTELKMNKPKIEILYFEFIPSDKNILEIEEFYQRLVYKDVWDNEYFNLSYATGKFTTYGKSPSKEARLKQSISLKNSKKNSGKNHGMYGKTHSQKAKNKIKISLMKQWDTGFRTGTKHTQEAKNKIGISSALRNKGKNNPLYGTRPWKTPRSIKSGTSKIWLLYAEQLYDVLKPDFIYKSKVLNELGLKNFRPDNLIKHFKLGWNPYLDLEFQKDKKCHNS